MQLNLSHRLFDLGVAIVIVALLAVLLHISWSHGTKLYRRLITEPRLEAARQTQLEHRRVAAAQAGDDRALHLFAEAGYTVVAKDQEGLLPLAIDGEAAPCKVKAEWVVSREGKLFIAEVRSGSPGPSTKHPATRRQLLEYSLVFDVAGILLVDLRGRRVQVVQFPDYRVAPKPAVKFEHAGLSTALVVGFALGLLVSWLALRLAWPFLANQ